MCLGSKFRKFRFTDWLDLRKVRVSQPRGYDGVETLTTWQCEEERDRKGLGQDTALKVILPVTHFLQPGPASQCFCHVPTIPSNYQPVHKLIGGLGQNCHDTVRGQ